jgi:hypothetical protein
MGVIFPPPPPTAVAEGDVAVGVVPPELPLPLQAESSTSTTSKAIPGMTRERKEEARVFMSAASESQRIQIVY